MRRKELRRS